jgi:hypothetical protein
MNILARMDDLWEKERIEDALPSFSVNLFYARHDQTMLWLAKNASIDAVVIGIHSEPDSVLRSVKTLKHGFVHIPYLCFYAHRQNEAVWSSQTLEQACLSFGASNFIIADESGDEVLMAALNRMVFGEKSASSAAVILPAGRKELVG